MSLSYGLIGEKLGHSFSKLIHEDFGYYTYDLIELSPDELKDFMTRKDFKGINVTIPYKQSVIPYCHELDESVKRIGAANTIINTNGTLKAYNTDFYGILKLLDKNDIQLNDKIVMILGSGGTSKTLQAVCAYLRAKEVLIVSRNPSESMMSYEEAQTRSDTQVIINATPIGMYPHQQACPIHLETFTNCESVIDVIYNPLKTELILKAQKRGLKTANGLWMLVAQAKVAAEKFLDQQLDDTLIEKVHQKLMYDLSNIVLIGMPSSGKSTLARRCGELMNKAVEDTDALIETDIKMNIQDLFVQKGESTFRALEHEFILKSAQKTACIIATGGGAILNEANIQALRQNGILFFIDRDLKLLDVGGHRPLSMDSTALKALYTKRYPLYLKACDVHLTNNDSLEDTLKKIKEAYDALTRS